MKSVTRRTLRGLATAGILLGATLVTGSTALAGSIFLTGHDPDFHASLGGNAAGAIRLNQVAISFIQDPGFNPFYLGGATKFLFVESSIAVPAGHTVGKNGIVASGYTEGVHFDHATAATLNAGLNNLGTVYSAIVAVSYTHLTLPTNREV